VAHTDNDLVAAFVKHRDHLEAAEKQFKQQIQPYKDAMGTIANELLRRLIERGAQNTKTDAGTAYIAEHMTTKIVNRQEFLQFVRDTWDEGGDDLLQAQVNKTALRALLENAPSSPPPGVDVSFYRQVQVTKA
jgi:predicted transcriptional regulator